MRIWLGAIALVGGCLPMRPIQQVTTTHVVEQRAIVPAPAAPLAIGAPLERGQSMVLGGASYAATQGGARPLGQQVAPLLGVGRIASGVSDSRFEVAVSGAAGPAAGAADPSDDRVQGFSGMVGRGDLGFRGWTPLRGSDLQWGWTLDVGALASVYRRTDRWIAATRTGDTSAVAEDEVVLPDAVRVHPDLRLGSVLRLPVPALLGHAVLGLEAQTWPVYWASGSTSETCTTYVGAYEDCVASGRLPKRPAHLAAVLSPSIGGAWAAGDLVVHVQAYAHLGPSEVGRVPGGVVLMLERRAPVGARTVADAD